MNIKKISELLVLLSSIEEPKTEQLHAEFELISGVECPLEIGKAYLFRTVTYTELGVVTAINGNFVTLKNASWIPDTGRFHDCLKTGTFSEVEPYPGGTIVNIASSTNITPWPHSLPTAQK